MTNQDAGARRPITIDFHLDEPRDDRCRSCYATLRGRLATRGGRCS